MCGGPGEAAGVKPDIYRNTTFLLDESRRKCHSERGEESGFFRISKQQIPRAQTVLEITGPWGLETTAATAAESAAGAPASPKARTTGTARR